MPNLKPEEVSDRVTEIGKLAEEESNEEAHIAEDQLYKDTLYAVAHAPQTVSRKRLQEMCREVLKVRDLSFDRYYS